MPKYDRFNYVINEEYTWKILQEKLPELIKQNKQKIFDNYYDIYQIAYNICNNIKDFSIYFTAEDKRNIPYKELYFILRKFLESKRKEVSRIVYNEITKLSKFITFHPQDPNYPVASSYAMRLIESLYPEFKALLKNKKIISDLYKNIADYWETKQILEPLIIEIINNKIGRLTQIEYKVLIEYALNKYAQLIKDSIKKGINKVLTADEKKIFTVIDKYIADNIYQLFLSTNLLTDENNMYIQSWIGPTGNLEDGHELEILKLILIENEAQIRQLIDIDFSYKEIVNTYILLHGSKWEKKIWDLISAKNAKLKIKRGDNLLNHSDEIGDEFSIDYDITNDYVRSRPLIIIKDTNTNKDFVMFGSKGTSHGYYITNKLIEDTQAKNINIDPYKMGYGYLLGKIAFIDKVPDENQFGYSNDEIIDILIKDPRIEKVYQTGGHPHEPGDKIKRLAELI